MRREESEEDGKRKRKRKKKKEKKKCGPREESGWCGEEAVIMKA